MGSLSTVSRINSEQPDPFRCAGTDGRVFDTRIAEHGENEADACPFMLGNGLVLGSFDSRYLPVNDDVE